MTTVYQDKKTGKIRVYRSDAEIAKRAADKKASAEMWAILIPLIEAGEIGGAA
jgi:hypothetical protein